MGPAYEMNGLGCGEEFGRKRVEEVGGCGEDPFEDDVRVEIRVFPK